MRKLWGAVLAVGLAACGSSVEKEPFDAGAVYGWCNYAENEGRVQCSGNKLLVCNHGVERPYSCSGSMGCNANGGRVFCDMSNANGGDACPAIFENSAVCRAGVVDGGVLLHCLDGGFVATACKRCYQQSDKIHCDR